MKYKERLFEAGQKAAMAWRASKQADEERDHAIRQASYHGGLSAREISAVVGISHQRVAQILKKDPIGPERPSLHQAMADVLAPFGRDWVPVREVAHLVNEKSRYLRRDRTAVSPAQVRARAAKHPERFEGTTDGTNRIRLRD